MQIALLTANKSTPLTKEYTLDEGGNLVKHPYPHVGKFSSLEYKVANLKDFMAVMRTATKHNACLLKGVPTRQLANESRRGSHNPVELTNWICLDIDGDATGATVAEFLERLGLGGIEYILQHSCSAGVDGNTALRCHVFMLLDKPASPALLKAWLIKLNLETEELNHQLSLTASARGLKYVLDVTTCQNDKLLYIQPPVLGEGISTSFKGARFQHVKGKAWAKNLVTTSILDGVNPASINAAKSRNIDRLREMAGHPRHKERTKQVANTTVCANPAETIVTGILEGDEFIRLNLNGGTSWAYWHPVTSIEVIYSFKDELPALASALVPEYYDQYNAKLEAEQEEFMQQEVVEDEDTEGLLYLAFLDSLTDTYFYGTHNTKTYETDLHSTGKRPVITDFWIQNQIPPREFVPQWTYDFDPHRPTIDIEGQFLNRWQPTRYERNFTKQGKLRVPKHIDKVIRHVLAYDEEIYEHFLNWLSCIVQYKMRTETAFLIHGRPGTGKGFLFSKILAPILGDEYTDNRQLKDFANRFRASAPNKFITLVDEADVDNMLKRDMDDAIATLKHQITEDRVHYEVKYVISKLVHNYANYLIASNRIVPLVIEEHDRRFNIAPRQEEKLKMDHAFKKAVEAELQAFMNYLMSRTADRQVARTVIDNSVKEKLLAQHLSSLSEVGTALKHGDLAYFVAELPFKPPRDLWVLERLVEYEDTIARIFHYEGVDFKHPRDQLQLLCEFVEPTTPKKGKFSAFLRKEAGLMIAPMCVRGASTRGLSIKWDITDAAREGWAAYLKRNAKALDRTTQLADLEQRVTH